jgi:hypothetical protein
MTRFNTVKTVRKFDQVTGEIYEVDLLISRRLALANALKKPRKATRPSKSELKAKRDRADERQTESARAHFRKVMEDLQRKF